MICDDQAPFSPMVNCRCLGSVMWQAYFLRKIQVHIVEDHQCLQFISQRSPTFILSTFVLSIWIHISCFGWCVGFHTVCIDNSRSNRPVFRIQWEKLPKDLLQCVFLKHTSGFLPVPWSPCVVMGFSLFDLWQKAYGVFCVKKKWSDWPSQPANQPISQPGNQSASQATNQIVRQQISHSGNQPTSQPGNQPTSQPLR